MPRADDAAGESKQHQALLPFYEALSHCTTQQQQGSKAVVTQEAGGDPQFLRTLTQRQGAQAGAPDGDSQ